MTAKQHIPKGYKQTKVGVIPEEWEVKEIADFAYIIGGGTPSSTNSKYWNGNINWFTPSEIGDSKYANESKRKITEEGYKNSSARMLPVGSILLTSRAGIGDTAILKVEACTNQGFQSLLIKENYNNEYVYYLLYTIKAELLSRASGSTFLEISPDKLKSIKLPLPPKPEQAAIARALSDMDALIEAQEKLIAKKRLIKQGAMQELLKPKKHWVKKRLGEVGTIATGGTPPTKSEIYWNGSYPWITPTDISDKKEIYTSERLITKEGAQLAGIIPSDSLLVSCIASIGKNTVLKTQGACNQQINSITPKKGYDVDFLYYLIENNKNNLLEKAGVTATLIISKKAFSELIFDFPEVNIQIDIARKLSSMDSEIETQEKKLTKYRKIKEGMMQELLTGKTRLFKI